MSNIKVYKLTLCLTYYNSEQKTYLLYISKYGLLSKNHVIHKCGS